MNATLSQTLLAWYDANKRELPWRETTDPYLIWISEIIMQQTRVAQGLDYYNRFVTRFPDIRSLAVAPPDEVMRYWQGLGYYSRARNLHAAAAAILTRFAGIFPQDYWDVISLPGIGQYTAAAICSFAWRKPYAVVDGNVYRVLARFFGVDVPIDSTAGKKYFAALAQELIDTRRPDLYNQAIMDFGALQCLPKGPGCTTCPLCRNCVALATGQTGRLPVKEGKITIKPRYFNYLHIRSNGCTLLSRREAKDIWQYLYEYPLIETPEDTDFTRLQSLPAYRRLFDGVGDVRITRMITMPKHILSHRIIYAHFYELQIARFSEAMQEYMQIPDDEMEQYPISRLIQLYLEHNNSIIR